MKNRLRIFIFAITIICFLNSFIVNAVTEQEAKKLCRELKELLPKLKIESYETFCTNYSLVDRLFQSPLDACWTYLIVVKRGWYLKESARHRPYQEEKT
jgi:hypothetical protein